MSNAFAGLGTYLGTRANYTIDTSPSINLLNAGINVAIMTVKIMAFKYGLVCSEGMSERKCEYEQDGAYVIAAFSGIVAGLLLASSALYLIMGACDAKKKTIVHVIRSFSLLSLVCSGIVLFFVTIFSSDVKVDPTFYAALVVSIVEASRNFAETNAEQNAFNAAVAAAAVHATAASVAASNASKAYATLKTDAVGEKVVEDARVWANFAQKYAAEANVAVAYAAARAAITYQDGALKAEPAFPDDNRFAAQH